MVRRRLWVEAEAAEYARSGLAFPGLRALLRLDTVRLVPGQEPVVETRYFASSLDPRTTQPEQFLRLARGHWRIENGLHYIKDRWWDEDRHVCRRPGLALGFTTLLTAALSVLRTTLPGKGKQGGMRAQADALSWEPSRAVTILTAFHT